MWRRTEKAHCTVFLGLILAIFPILALFPCAHLVSVTAQTGVAVDLYTDQAPFDGKGANQSADAYEPQELVVLFALATYNDAPVAGKLAAFQINGPKNQFQNITVVGSGTTNENGIAEFSFRLPWPSQTPEKAIFGQWIALATVEIAEQVVVDTLTFRVGWILSIVETVTLNTELSPQSIFTRRDPIVFNLTVQNTARIEKSAIIRVEVKDSDQQPIIYIQMESRVFQPGNSNVKATSQIPSSAETGLANVSAAPFTAPPDQGGKLYSPAICTTFTISGGGIDIAITSVTLSSNQVLSGEIVNIRVTVLNKGNESETFDVSVYYNSTWIATSQDIQLAPSTQKTIAFNWNTSSVINGVYQISASAPLAGDPTPSDNTFVDGTVTILPYRPFFPTLDWLILFIPVILGAVASMIFLLLVLCSRRRRRRRRPSGIYTVIAHPHI